MAGVPNHDYGGTVLRGAQTQYLDQFALLDKIINIKFIRRSGAFFVLRSDYEVHLTADGQPQFVYIKQKPAISVKYRQVSNNTSIQVDVRVTNLYFDTAKAGVDTFTNTGDPVVQMVIQMGYRTQFPNWTYGINSYDPPDVDDNKKRLKLFYELANYAIVNRPEQLDTAMQIAVKVLATYNESSPPDRVTYFQGIVGTMDYGMPFTFPGRLQEWFKDDSNFPRPGLSALERLYFTMMTCRFFLPAINARIEDNGVNAKPRYTVYVWDYAGDGKWHTVEEQVAKETDKRWFKFEALEANGIMPQADALELGVRVYCTKAAIDYSRNNRTPATTADGTTEAAASAERIPAVPFMYHEGAQMQEIQQQYPKLRWYRYMNGHFLVYHVNESIEELSASLEAEGKYAPTAEEKDRIARWKAPCILPAVYDITLSGVRTIRCPFISFLSPGQKIEFVGKYNISDMVGFYYPHPDIKQFRIITADVEFDTDGDANMMTIMCVDVAPDKAE